MPSWSLRRSHRWYIWEITGLCQIRTVSSKNDHLHTIPPLFLPTPCECFNCNMRSFIHDKQRGRIIQSKSDANHGIRPSSQSHHLFIQAVQTAHKEYCKTYDKRHKSKIVDSAHMCPNESHHDVEEKRCKAQYWTIIILHLWSRILFQSRC